MSSGKKSMPNEKDDELAEMIKGLCAKLDLAQEQFAAKVGVMRPIVNRWEEQSGERVATGDDAYQDFGEAVGGIAWRS